MEFLNIVLNTIKNINVFDLLDISIVAYALYKAYMLIKETRAEQLLRGILFILVLIPISYLLNLTMVYTILKNTLTIGVLTIVILFQPEIRKALEHLGRSAFSDIHNKYYNSYVKNDFIVEICKGIANMSSKNVGALIVIERNTKLADIVESGTKLNSKISSEVIETIFFPNSPLHDGAIIIREGLIEAAGCFLPLSYQNIDKSLGTRHRAALGISEISDAAVIVVSEESGIISLVVNGKMTRNYDFEKLNSLLSRMFVYNNLKSASFKGRVKGWIRKKIRIKHNS
ncbi:MAG TPA: diadenylate cyclase CdaA [Candidatus Dwaynia gallinarum]|nr:diadenylate cyclase CdaA [Candidatus Dwaynia gallinarum]